MRSPSCPSDADDLHRRHPVHRGDPDRVGRAPLGNWVAACDLILGLDVDTVVPGHGPVTDKAGVVEVRDYPGVRGCRGRRPACGRRRRMGGGPPDRGRDRRRPGSSPLGASTEGSPSTWTPCTATSTRHTTAPTWSSSSVGWPHWSRRRTPVDEMDVDVHATPSGAHQTRARSSSIGGGPRRRFGRSPARVAALRRTARTQPTTAHRLKVNHWIV